MNEEFGTRKLRVGPVVCDRKSDANGSVSQKKLIELMNIRNMYSNAMGRFEESKSDLMTFLSTTDVRDIPLDLSSDIITHLKKCIMVQKKKNEQNRRELMATRSEYSKMETKLKEVIEAINGIEGKTGIKMAREDLTRFRPHSTVRDEISELRSHIDTAQAELKNAELLNRRKMQLVKELTETLDQRKEFHEQLFELRNDYRVAVREFTVFSKNVDAMYNEHKSTDLILYSHTREREEANHRLKHLFEDVELLENVKENVENDVSTQIRMIAAQRYRLDCLKNRLEKLSECLVDLGLFEAIQSHINDLTQEPQRFNSFSSPEEVIPSNDKVAVELLDLAQSALEHLEKHLAIRELLVVERDQAVESLESKLASISTKHNDENQERENLKQQFEMKMESERQELEAREQAIREGLDALNVENAQLKRELISIH